MLRHLRPFCHVAAIGLLALALNDVAADVDVRHGALNVDALHRADLANAHSGNERQPRSEGVDGGAVIGFRLNLLAKRAL